VDKVKNKKILACSFTPLVVVATGEGEKPGASFSF
jgi:hypothetical protein